MKSINAILSQHHIKGQCNVIGVQKQYTVMPVERCVKKVFEESWLTEKDDGDDYKWSCKL